MTNYTMPDQGAVAWMHNYARKNYWKVAAWMDLDDLIQEGYWTWFRWVCKPDIAHDAAHQMYIFKMAYAQTITDLSRKKMKQEDDARSDIIEVFDGDVIKYDPSNFNLLMAKAPKLVRDTINLLTSGIDELNKPYEKEASGRRETLNERVCALLKLDPKKVNAVEQTRLYFAA